MKWSALAERVHQSIKRKSLLQEKDKILVAVSGGMDSVVLLHVFLELRDYWKWELIVGHVDHGLRQDEDKKESALCRSLAENSGLKYFETRINLNDIDSITKYAISSTQNPSLESLARNERYAVFNKWADEENCDAICIGHHLSDQAETVLYRMLTGSGFKGLRGIQVKRDRIKRPLIEISKNDIISYVRDLKLKYYDDPSNLDERFVRNLIRYKVIPGLKEFGFDNIETKLASSAHAIEEANEALQHYVNIAFKNVVLVKKDNIELQFVKLIEYPKYVQKQILRKIFDEYLGIIKHISEKQLAQLLAFINDGNTGSSTELLQCRVIKDRQTVKFVIEKENMELGDIEIEEIDISSLPSLVPENNNMAYFSYDILGEDLFLKSWEPGDSMKLFGNGQSKKVSDILKDEKVSALKKAEYPVLLSGAEIIWIPGIKRSDLYKARSNDEKLIKITYTNMELDNDQKTLTLNYGGDFDGEELDLLISEEQIQDRIKILGRQITADYKNKRKPPIMIGVLNGSFYFMADLLRAMDMEAEMDFIKISSYVKTGSTGTIRLIKDISAVITDRDIILVEDIVDTGLSINYLRRHFENSSPASVRVATLLFKKEITRVEVEPEYVGFNIPDKFVVGYGLDIEQQYRRLKDIFAMTVEKN